MPSLIDVGETDSISPNHTFILDASLYEESLATLIVEVEDIVNSKPFTVETINVVNGEMAFTKSYSDNEFQGSYVSTWFVWNT